MICPGCGEESNMRPRSHSWIEDHGEPCYQEWWHCPLCGHDCDDKELDESNSNPDTSTKLVPVRANARHVTFVPSSSAPSFSSAGPVLCEPSDQPPTAEDGLKHDLLPAGPAGER